MVDLSFALNLVYVLIVPLTHALALSPALSLHIENPLKLPIDFCPLILFEKLVSIFHVLGGECHILHLGRRNYK